MKLRPARNALGMRMGMALSGPKNGGGSGLSVTITSPPAGSYPEDEQISIVGTVSQLGATVTVTHGATNLGSAVVVGLNWSLLWTPSAPVAAANLVAHATVGAATADSAPVSITIVVVDTPDAIFADIPFFFWVRCDTRTLNAGGTSIAQLADKISGGGHTAINFDQVTESLQPAYSATGGPNSTPIASSDGSDDQLVSTFTPSGPVAVPRWIWYVVRANSPASGAGLSGCGGSTRQAVRWITGTGWQLSGGGTAFTVAATNSTWGLLLVNMTGAASNYMEWRGNRASPGVSAGTLAGVQPLRFGAYSATNGWGTFDLAEWGELTAEPTANQIVSLKGYVNLRYGAGLTTGG